MTRHGAGRYDRDAKAAVMEAHNKTTGLSGRLPGRAA